MSFESICKRWFLNNKKILVFVLVSLIPIIFPLIILELVGSETSFRVLCASGGDSAFWWLQADSLVNYGGIHGYYGFNGSNAPLGGFYNWGAAPLLPYFLFGKVFGWKLFSMTVANVIMISLAIFVFLVLSDSNVKTAVKIAIVYVCSFYAVGYSMYSTNEGERYALGIILAGLVLYVRRRSFFTSREDKRKDFTVVMIILLFVLYASVVILPLLIALPLLLVELFRKNDISRMKKVVYVFFIGVSITIASIGGFYVFSAPFLSSSVTSKGGFAWIIKDLVNTLVNNLESVNLFNIIHYDSKPLFWFFIIYIIVVVISTYNFAYSRSYESFMPAYYVVGFLMGICLLDTGEPNSVSRLINIGLLMGVFSECVLHDNNRKEANGMVNLVIAYLIISIISVNGAWKMYKNAYVEGSGTYEIEKALFAEREKFDGSTLIDESTNGFDNTVAYYGLADRMCLALPGGAGINYMYNQQVDDRMKYAVIRTENFDYNELLNNLELVYDVVFRDEYFILLERQ